MKIQTDALLESLISIQINLDVEKMRECFGRRMGEHLWNKFKRFDKNIVFFYSSLDSENRDIFIRLVEKTFLD
jgi:hypothetical protein